MVRVAERSQLFPGEYLAWADQRVRSLERRYVYPGVFALPGG